MGDQRPKSRTFLVTMASAFLFKLWLTSATRIVPAYAPHDALNFLWHAKSIAMGHWLGPYDELTLIKLPFFPMYMAGVQEFGIPLPIAHLLLYGLACFVACFAVRPLVKNDFALSAMFVALYFNPMENNVYSWSTTRSQVNGSLALMALACACGLYVRRRETFRHLLPWSLAFGASFAAFWNTREEAIWMVLPLIVLAAAFLYPAFRSVNSATKLARLGLVAIPASIWALAIGAIMLVNGTIYGWYTTAENLSPEVVGAYNSLARIEPGAIVDRYYPIPHAARMIAYRISPAARELEPYFEGRQGTGWIGYGCQQFDLCADIHVGWFIWALRDAVSTAGYYTDGSKARTFYVRLANEIDAACAAKTIACRAKGRTLSPPFERSDIPAFIADIGRGILSALKFENFQSSPSYYVGPPSIRLDYDFIVRSVDDGFGKEPTASDDDLKRAIIVEIAGTYAALFLAWTALAFVAVIARASRAAFARAPHATGIDYIIVVLALTVGFLSLVAVLALVDTLAFPSFNADYMSPLFPLLIFAVTLVTAIEAPNAMRFVAARLPAPMERVSC
jgi:hypothetical protein